MTVWSSSFISMSSSDFMDILRWHLKGYAELENDLSTWFIWSSAESKEEISGMEGTRGMCT